MNRFTRFLAGTLMATTAFAGMAGTTFVGDRTDFRDETIYFAMTTRFYDGDPTNNVLCWDGVQNQVQNNDPAWRGDFKGLIDKLDYIKALGFTAIWITPIVQNASGFDYHGYHAMDFSEVDVRYKSKKAWGADEDVDFKTLIDKAHEKDIKIILDIVLQHTGNFGEKKFAHLFDRDQNIKSQANIEKCMIPTDLLGGDNYWKLDPNTQQYPERFKYLKNTDGQNHDTNNYWHHVANAWNWDEPSRWWGQIAGDCVDLNTENPAVVDYLVQCYGEFIKMGVDGFRIDTTGHIAPLTFNAAFIPKFVELGEKYKSARKGNAPFYMFGECCARYGSVVYRDQHVLSSHYYTWKSDPALVNEWNQYPASWWAQQNVPEGASPLGNMLTCLKDPATVYNSKNVFMQNGAWHEPDYSQASGFNVIDFPMHYNFNNAGQAMEIARNGDKFYNDASWNVVYVDSHDYCPGPNDGVRFNGGTAQWAENLSMMFTFRGIPCIYYGSEVEFQKGKTIDEGPKLALVNSGRAYFGTYLEGSVTAGDFGEIISAEGNVKKTLNADLAQHIRRLNQLRAAVPALRKGQYTFDGCSANGGWAYKRAYKDSYCLVALNGGATFSNVPAGTYTDIVTGKTYQGGGSITVDAPKTKGQLRILVKDWTGGKVGEDGKFIYTASPVSHGGNVTFTDPGTTRYYKAEDAPDHAGLTLSPAGGTFKTPTLDITISLNDEAVSGWYKLGADGQQVNLGKGQQKTITIGGNMNYGDAVTLYWGVSDATGAKREGTATYKKVDPNASITVYVNAPGNFNMYAWGKNGSGKSVEPLGAWPGSMPTNSTVIDGEKYYYYSFDDMESVNVIFNANGQQTGNIEGITSDAYYKYDGATKAEKADVATVSVPKVKLTPNGGSFENTLTVTASLVNATSGWYKIGDGAQKNFSGTTSFTIGGDMAEGQSVTVTWSATDGTQTQTGSATYTKEAKQVAPTGYSAYFDNSRNWSEVYAYAWNSSDNKQHLGAWPGTKLTQTYKINGKDHYVVALPEAANDTKIIFNGNGNGNLQTADFDFEPMAIYNAEGKIGMHEISGIFNIDADADVETEYYTLQGIRVYEPTPGIYIVRRGNKTAKVLVR